MATDARTIREQRLNLKGKSVEVVLPWEYIAEVDAYARQNGLSRSAVLRMRLLNPEPVSA